MAPVSVVVASCVSSSCGLVGSCIYGSSLLFQGVAPVSRFDASVDIDDYQKRSPVENVLESTGNSHVVVSNRGRGKHSSDR